MSSATATSTAAAAATASANACMPAAERPVVFDCQGERLLGIVHPASGSTGVVVVVGGPQYRAGSHRLFVQLARTLAAAGHPVLRFDVRGMGDSTGPQRSFEDLGDDIGAAITQLQQQQPQVQHVVLWGLCDGASAALLYLHDHADPRVTGLCLLNPWVRSAQSQARTQVKHYYLQRLTQRGFWLKLLSGRVAAGALFGLWTSIRAAAVGGQSSTAAAVSFQIRMARGWKDFGKPVLLCLSGDDYTAKEFLEFAAANPAWRGLTDLPDVSKLELPLADHTLSDLDAAHFAQTEMLAWLHGVRGRTGSATPGPDA